MRSAFFSIVITLLYVAQVGFPNANPILPKKNANPTFSSLLDTFGSGALMTTFIGSHPNLRPFCFSFGSSVLNVDHW